MSIPGVPRRAVRIPGLFKGVVEWPARSCGKDHAGDDVGRGLQKVGSRANGEAWEEELWWWPWQRRGGAVRGAENYAGTVVAPVGLGRIVMLLEERAGENWRCGKGRW